MPALEALAAELQGRAQFQMVYIAEAHACDVWPITSGRFHDNEPVMIEAPKSDAERCAVATRFKERYQLSQRLPVLVDPVANPFEEAYAVWPFRFYILQRPAAGGSPEVVFKAMPKDASYDITEARDFLLSLGV